MNFYLKITHFPFICQWLSILIGVFVEKATGLHAYHFLVNILKCNCTSQQRNWFNIKGRIFKTNSSKNTEWCLSHLQWNFIFLCQKFRISCSMPQVMAKMSDCNTTIKASILGSQFQGRLCVRTAYFNQILKTMYIHSDLILC